jgi:hypothetical protein
VLDFQPHDGVFDSVAGQREACPSDWPSVGVNQAIADPRQMLMQQLHGVYEAVRRKTWSVPCIRCNYGTGILPSLFGARMFWMPDELETLPTTWPLEGEDAMDRLLDTGPPDLSAGLGGRVFETGQYFLEALAPYPKVREAVWLYHPDLQGPIDVVELLWGSAMYYAFHETPDRIRAVTDLVTRTYIRFLRRWLQLAPPRGDGAYMAHWGGLYKGQVMLRDDAIVNLSPAMYRDFVKPFDERVMETFGGGAIHFCGRADHCIEIMTDSRWLTAVNMSQPHLNDMVRIYNATVKRGVILNVRPTDEMRRTLDLSSGVIAR